jgi:Na+/H+ antiporter NhaD/arsenite permease-like protein
LKLLRCVYSRFTEDLLLLALVLGFALLMFITPFQWRLLPGLVEWHTIAILAGLMVLSRGLEDSGALARAGGFGLAIGSLANLIALRLSRQPGLWLAFHAWSLPMLAISLLGAYLLSPLPGS